MVKLTGGGIQSNKTVQSRSGVKREPVTHRGNVEGVGAIGLSHAYKPPEMLQGKGYEPRPVPATGVKGTFNSATSGPGSGRTIMPAGSQAEYGNRGSQPTQTRPMPAGRDILSEYGPESVTSRGKR
jgi:hypothetical protein